MKIDEEENNDNNYNNENNDNTNDNIYNSYNVENEIKLVNPDNMKNRKSDVIENGKTISPIISSQGTDENRIKKEKNDIIGQYVNNNPEKNDNLNDSNANKPISEEIIDDSHPDKRNFEVQNVKEFVINKNDNLELTPEKKFSIYHGKERNSSDTKDDYKKHQNREGKLIFNNDEEVVDYIKKRLKDDIDEEYNSGIKYNFFNLQKKFRGRILYEIGLENDIKKINAILEKQNVKFAKYYYRNEGERNNPAVMAFREAKKSGNMMGGGAALIDALSIVSNAMHNYRELKNARTTVFAKRYENTFAVVINEPYLHGNEIKTKTYYANLSQLDKLGLRVK